MKKRSAIIIVDLLKGFFKSNPTLPDPLDAKRLFATVRRVIDAGRDDVDARRIGVIGFWPCFCRDNDLHKILQTRMLCMDY